MADTSNFTEAIDKTVMGSSYYALQTLHSPRLNCLLRLSYDSEIKVRNDTSTYMCI